MVTGYNTFGMGGTKDFLLNNPAAPLAPFPASPLLTLEEGRLSLEGSCALLLEHPALGLDVVMGLEKAGLSRLECRDLSLRRGGEMEAWRKRRG